MFWKLEIKLQNVLDALIQIITVHLIKSSQYVESERLYLPRMQSGIYTNYNIQGD